MSSRQLVIGGGLLSLVAFAWWVLQMDGASEADVDTAGSAFAHAPREAEDSRENRAGSLEDSESDAVVSRESAVADTEEEAAEAAKMITFSGRCVAAETGEPLAGCEVKLHGFGTNSSDEAMRAEVEWEDPLVQVTGTDGRFFLEFPDLNPFQYVVDIRHPGRVTRSGRWSDDLTADNPRDFGDIALQKGAVMRGQVRTVSGEPVPEAHIRVNGLTDVDLERAGYLKFTGGISDEEGTYELDRSAIPPGTWLVDVDKTGFLIVEPDTVTVAEGQAEVVVDFTVRALPFVSGRVHFPDGTPAPQVRVTAETGLDGRTASGRTSADGVFRIYATQADTTPFPLSIEGKSVEAWETETTYSWGQRDIALSVQLALSFELTVLEAESGLPVEGYAVMCHRANANSTLYTDKRLGGEHANGKVIVDGVFRGENELVVIPWDPALRVSERSEFLATDGGLEPQVVKVERMKPLMVKVIRPDGSAVSSAKLRATDLPITGQVFLIDPRTGGGSFFGTRVERPEVVSAAETDSGGLAQLYFPESIVEGGIQVEVSGAKESFPLVRPLEQDSPLIITVGGAGVVAGVLHHPDVASGDVAVSVERVDGLRLAGRGPLEVTKDGQFRGELPTGEYRAFLMVYRRTLFGRGGGSSGSWVKLEPALAAFAIEDGEETLLDLETGHLTPGILKGRVLMNGEPVPNARYQFMYHPPVDNPRSNGTPRYIADSDGAFTLDDLVPGSYKMILHLGDVESGEDRFLMLPDSVEVRSKETTSTDFLFLHRTLRVRIIRGDTGEPLADSKCSGPQSVGRNMVTDDNGWLTISPAPMGTFKLSIFNETERLMTEDLQVDPEQEETVLEVKANPYQR